MMQDVYVNSNTGFLWQEQHSIIRRIKLKEETTQSLHMMLALCGAFGN
jgi:hypothetical protein